MLGVVASGGHGHDDDDFERLMEGLPRTRSLREAPSQSRKIGSSTHIAAPLQSRRPPTSSQLGSKKGKKGVILVEDPLDIADAETLDPNAEDNTPSLLDSPRLPNSASHDSMSTSGSSSDGGGGGGGDTPQGGGGGNSGQGGGGGGGIAFTEEQYFRGATQDTNNGAPLQYNRRQKSSRGDHAEDQ
ncbi:hypothetical protein Taro_024035 [Colocasia esculenta]|uniref:Uncharacterized protein n=1 Tax=Colocasia esculenta TaxID=4460 RepID=A0A843V5B7_COLES|nr:hypothetical protein [Colocasia esculenta]